MGKLETRHAHTFSSLRSSSPITVHILPSLQPQTQFLIPICISSLIITTYCLLSLSSKFTLSDCPVKAHLGSLQFFLCQLVQRLCRQRAPERRCGRKFDGLPAAPRIPPHPSTWLCSRDSSETRLCGQISTKCHQHNSTATRVPFSEPWRRRGLLLTEPGPTVRIRICFSCLKSFWHPQSGGRPYIPTALCLTTELTPEQREDGHGITPMDQAV